MTLIASIKPKGSPILLGDLLLSSGTSGAPTVDLPTLGKVQDWDDLTNLNNREKLSHVGLVQKVNILSKNLVVAWAGNYVRAVSILKILRDGLDESNITTDLVLKFIHENRDIIEDKVNLIGLVRMKCGTVRSFYYNANMFNVPDFAEFIYAGTGSMKYYYDLLNFSTGPRGSSKFDKYPDDLLEAAATAWRLIGLELASGDPLFSYYGGGFEVAFVSTRQVVKIDDIIHHCWGVDPTDLSKPPVLLGGSTKYNYRSGDLIIRRIRPSSRFGEKGRLPATEQTYTIKPTVSRHDLGCEREYPLDYSATWSCNHFFAPLQDGRYVLQTSTVFNANRNGPVKPVFDGNEVYFEQNMPYLEECRRLFLEGVKLELQQKT